MNQSGKEVDAFAGGEGLLKLQVFQPDANPESAQKVKRSSIDDMDSFVV